MKVKSLLVSDMYAKGWFVFLIMLFVVLNGVMFFQWDSNLNYLAIFNAIVIYFDSFFIVAFIVNAFSFIFKKGIYEK
ncbi:hypothetical protein [Serratia nevei]|uniref:hypothetical protein n=1 Tax=Serratia nevei TaxID=2703794 RepID=UPI00301D1EF0